MNEVITLPRLSPIYTGLKGDIEKVAQEIKDEKDLERGFHVLETLKNQEEAIDSSVGIVLNVMDELWKPEEHDGEKFEQAVHRRVGLHPTTVYRHLRIQEALPLIPAPYQEQIEEKGFKEKIRIANTILGGYELDDEDFRDFAEAVGEKEVGRVARSITGKPPRSNWLNISMDDNGRLWVHTNKGTNEVGRLYIHSDNEDVQKAIVRLTSEVQQSTEY